MKSKNSFSSKRLGSVCSGGCRNCLPSHQPVLSLAKKKNLLCRILERGQEITQIKKKGGNSMKIATQFRQPCC